MRVRLGLTTREVDLLSRKIAAEEGNEELSISHARLIQIENGESTPSVYKLFTIAAIYGANLSDLLEYYVPLERLQYYHLQAALPNTHLMNTEPADPSRTVTFPVRFDAGFNPAKTTMLSRVIGAWGDIPIGLIQQLNLRKSSWGFIGMADYTMYPMLKPGSLVQVDEERQPKSTGGAFRSEYDRPLYFIELRDTYICCWCEFRKGKLLSIPHPLSPVGVREFSVPNEAEVIGRVTAIAARLSNPAAAEQPEKAAERTSDDPPVSL
ncbi:MAG TPA: helix-turn-helix transcriptional regulator [Bryobacteraceae bacterium]|jgi:transcriptional regulator with XRE-family HTH domain